MEGKQQHRPAAWGGQPTTSIGQGTTAKAGGPAAGSIEASTSNRAPFFSNFVAQVLLLSFPNFLVINLMARLIYYRFVVQFCIAMGKATQRRIDFVLKRKRDDSSKVEEDPLPAADDPLPLLELEQHQVINRSMPKVFALAQMNRFFIRGVEFQRDP